MKISVFKSLFNSKETPYIQEVVDVYNRIKEGYPELIDKITALRAIMRDGWNATIEPKYITALRINLGLPVNTSSMLAFDIFKQIVHELYEVNKDAYFNKIMNEHPEIEPVVPEINRMCWELGFANKFNIKVINFLKSKFHSNQVVDIGEFTKIFKENDPEDFAYLENDMNDLLYALETHNHVSLETFKGKTTKPGLIVKTQSATSSIMDRNEMLSKIQAIRIAVGGDDLPNVYLLHGEFIDEEINELYNHPKVKSFVSFTKGEGYGRPLLESTISQKPVIASNWSGHLDYLSPNMSILLPGAVNQIHPSAVVPNMLLAESGWFTVDYKQASVILKDVYNNYKKYIDRAKKQSYRSRTEFNLDKMGELLINILDKNVPKPLELKLPTLKKIG